MYGQKVINDEGDKVIKNRNTVNAEVKGLGFENTKNYKKLKSHVYIYILSIFCLNVLADFKQAILIAINRD